jgi:hypothetical protein
MCGCETVAGAAQALPLKSWLRSLPEGGSEARMCTIAGRHIGYIARTDLIRRTACEMTLKGDLEQVLQ